MIKVAVLPFLGFMALLGLMIASFYYLAEDNTQDCGLEPQSACKMVDEFFRDNSPSTLKVEDADGRSIEQTHNPQVTAPVQP